MMTSSLVLYLLSSALLLASSIILTIALFRSRRFSRHFFSASIALFIIFADSVGLALLPYLSWSLPYTDALIVYTWWDDAGSSRYATHTLAHFFVHLLFMIGIFALDFKKKRAISNKECGERTPTFTSGKLALLGVAVGIVWSVAFYIAYFVSGPGFELLRRAQLDYSSPEEAVTARSLALGQVEKGQGAYGASIAAFVWLPYLAFQSSLRIRRRGFFALLWALLFLASGAFALQTYQKAPVIAVVLQYISLLLFFSLRRVLTFNKQQIRLVGLAIMLASLASVGLYSINFGLTVVEAALSSVARIVLVPANTEGYWFAVYPNELPYLGVLRSIFMDVETIRYTAYVATGDVFSANASFIAVGWSGAGFVGVVLGTVLLLSYSLFIDWLGRGLSLGAKMGIILLTMPAFFFLVSGTVFDFIGKGGALPLLILLSIKRPTSQRAG